MNRSSTDGIGKRVQVLAAVGIVKLEGEAEAEIGMKGNG